MLSIEKLILRVTTIAKGWYHVMQVIDNTMNKIQRFTDGLVTDVFVVKMIKFDQFAPDHLCSELMRWSRPKE